MAVCSKKSIKGPPDTWFRVFKITKWLIESHLTNFLLFCLRKNGQKMKKDINTKAVTFPFGESRKLKLD